jgi:hypothetical protein
VAALLFKDEGIEVPQPQKLLMYPVRADKAKLLNTDVTCLCPPLPLPPLIHLLIVSNSRRRAEALVRAIRR